MLIDTHVFLHPFQDLFVQDLRTYAETEPLAAGFVIVS
jgi:hypothetical protein